MSDSAFALDRVSVKARQDRLVNRMRDEKLSLVVLTNPAHIQWLVGANFRWIFEPVAAIDSSGNVTLVVPEKPPVEVVADSVLTYEAQWHSTLRNDQNAACTKILLNSLSSSLLQDRVGVEYSRGGRSITEHMGSTSDIDPIMYELRRRKFPDEMAMIQKAISATERMYETARKIIQPGISELEVFNSLQSAAVLELGEMLTGTGNDYQCGSRGGSPRNGRIAEAGELYILDLGPAFRGYFADNCRTIAVTEANDEQLEAWKHVTSIFELIESSVKPGESAQAIFHEAQRRLDQAPVGVFNHHLGHGIGLFPHEAPHLNPNWDDRFEMGDVFTVEPGLYAPELHAGMRIENNYQVTENGVQLLTEFTLEL